MKLFLIPLIGVATLLTGCQQPLSYEEELKLAVFKDCIICTGELCGLTPYKERINNCGKFIGVSEMVAED